MSHQSRLYSDTHMTRQVVLFAEVELAKADTFVAQQDDLPRTKAEIQLQTSNTTEQHALIQDCVGRALPAFNFWLEKHTEPEIEQSRKMFQAAKYFNPLAIVEGLCGHNPPPDVLDALHAFNESCASVAGVPMEVGAWFDMDAINAMKLEWPAYLRQCLTFEVPVVDASWDADKKFEARGLAVLRFWRRIRRVVPCMFAALRKILLLKPSSATNERIFSMLARFFGPFTGAPIAICGRLGAHEPTAMICICVPVGRSMLLVDVIKLTLMYRFNDPRRSIWERWVMEDDEAVEQERKRARLECGQITG